MSKKLKTEQQSQYSGYALLLGAGASFGAFIRPSTPPLDAAFLAKARSVLGGKGRKGPGPKAWKHFRKTLKAAGLDSRDVVHERLELLSTYLEARAAMPSLQANVGRPHDYSRALDALKQVICHTLMRTGGTYQCPLHRLVIELVAPSCVVTFNYDLIADQTLLGMKRLNWTRRDYSGGMPLTLKRTMAKGSIRLLPNRKFLGCVPLLKLHGSMHWGMRAEGRVGLSLETIPSGTMRYAIPPKYPAVVPPVAAKMAIHAGHLRMLWSRAARHLQTAPGWLFWGYSFPPTDTVTQVLCRTALTNNKKPKPVIVIDPDPTVASRIERVLRKVRVKHFPSAERFLIEHGVSVIPTQ